MDGLPLILSHLSAHTVNRLSRENRKSIPNIFNGKKLLKKCNPPDFRFYRGKLNNKFPNVNFVSVFTALNNTKRQRKFNITPYRGNFYLST